MPVIIEHGVFTFFEHPVYIAISFKKKWQFNSLILRCSNLYYFFLFEENYKKAKIIYVIMLKVRN